MGISARPSISRVGRINLLRLPSLTVVGLLTLSLVACGVRGDVRGFSSYPGFSEYFAGHPAEKSEPNVHDRELLTRYRPRLILPPGHAGPIDFYRDYLPATRMSDLETDTVLADPPTAEDLWRHRSDEIVGLDLVREIKEPHAAVYGRVRREQVHFPTDDGERVLPMIFLSYNIPFARSGLPARLNWFERAGLSVMGWLAGWDANDWHELDVYVAYTLVLDDGQRPLAVVLAQHNHHRAYLIGKDLSWPGDDGLPLEVAASSNEIYLSSHSPEPVAHRTIPFPSRMDYLLSGENQPFLDGMDVTYGLEAGGHEADYELHFLVPADPFYTFKGRLGEYRPFMGFYVGRSGSPGADYYTLPVLLPLGNTLKFAYLHDGDAEDIAAVRRYISDDRMDIEGLMAYGGRAFWRDRQAQLQGRWLAGEAAADTSGP